MWWLIKSYPKQHLSISISVAFILSSIGMLLSEGYLQMTIGLVFLILGLLVIPICTLKRIHTKEIPTRKDCFKIHKTLWCLWYTGRDTLRLGLVEKYPDRIKKLLLINPESNGFNRNVEETGEHSQSSKENIIQLTKLAQEHNIPVKWYDNFRPQTLTFYDPESKNSWLLVTDLQRYTPVDSRPKHKYNKGDKYGEYRDNLASFNDIWENHSSDPII